MFEVGKFYSSSLERYSKVLDVPKLAPFFEGDSELRKEADKVLKMLNELEKDNSLDNILKIVKEDKEVKLAFEDFKKNEKNKEDFGRFLVWLNQYHLNKETEYEKSKEKYAKWKVENAGANVISRINLEAQDVLNNRGASLEALFEKQGGDIKEKVDALRELYTLSKSVDYEQARKIHFVAECSYYPTTNEPQHTGWKKCGVDLAARISEHYPVVFYEIFEAIMECIGKGSNIKKKL